PAGRHAGGQDQAAPFIEIRPGADSIVPAHLVDRRHPCLLDWDAKIIHLPQKSVPQFPAGHPGQAGVIQDTLCLFDLVTEPPAAKPEERKTPGPGGQRGRHPGRAGAHDQQIQHERRLLSIFYYAVYRAHRRRSRGIVYLVRNPAYFAGVSQYIPGIQKKLLPLPTRPMEVATAAPCLWPQYQVLASRPLTACTPTWGFWFRTSVSIPASWPFFREPTNCCLRNCYAGLPVQPSLESVEGTSHVVLPNMHAAPILAR